jgi:hypothetical protein
MSKLKFPTNTSHQIRQGLGVKALPYARAMLIFSISFQFSWIFHVRPLTYAKWTSPEFNGDTNGVIMLASHEMPQVSDLTIHQNSLI